jgi:hypothetical protein
MINLKGVLSYLSRQFAISGRDANKGLGNDGVASSFVKLHANELKSSLLHIFNLSLSAGTFPSKCKDSFLIPIFKTGKRIDGW